MKVSNFYIFTLIFFTLKSTNGCMKTPLVSETPDIPISRGGGGGGTPGPAAPPGTPGNACPACPNLPPLPSNGNSPGCFNPVYELCTNNMIMVSCTGPCIPVFNNAGFVSVMTCNPMTGSYLVGMTNINDVSCQSP